MPIVMRGIAPLCKIYLTQPITGATKATGVELVEAKSSGKLCALRSCITSIPRPARFKMSAQVLTTCPSLDWIDWLKLNPFRLNAMVLTPKAVNQIPTTGQAARKK
jgi:hypothetical protein